MSGRFVRVSKVRNAFGAVPKKEKTYQDLKPSTAGDGNYIDANSKYFALQSVGGGGPVLVSKLGDYKRFPANAPVVNVHAGAVSDLQWHPFNESLLATGSEDCLVKVSQIPDQGLTADLKEAAVTLTGHGKRITFVRFNPAANNVLASSSMDNTIKIWDIEKQSEALYFNDFADQIHSVEWNQDGSQLGTFCKDKVIRLFDPRDSKAVATAPSFQGAKQSRFVWFHDKQLFGGVGFSKNACRQLGIWDPRNLANPLVLKDIDQQAGVIMPFYDPDLSVLYLAGKGDGNVRLYELTGEAPYIHEDLNEFKSPEPTKGACFIPKRAVDTNVNEMGHFLRVCRTFIEPISFQIPRKSDLFQRDIYPDTFAGMPALSAEEWFAGENKPAVYAPVVPTNERQQNTSKAAAFIVSSSSSSSAAPAASEVASLKEQLAARDARVKELETEVASLRDKIAKLEAAPQ